ncbi:hypothetical protein T040910_155 [Synechococcus phage S-CAM3]|uniref:Uncharacterized protein n=1 Tax=Synechococcus phage S-CAM3 TaxID=1883366 RepID=A0A1D8KJR3_9CAUD|nr:hypothetical protein T040910_155 [Synechococcus phage S-CAM3]
MGSGKVRLGRHWLVAYEVSIGQSGAESGTEWTVRQATY